MNKIILIILIFTNLLFSSTHKDLEVLRQSHTQDTIQTLINKDNVSYLFLNKKSINRYYKIFNYELIWINQNEVKDISLELISSIQNDPVLKHHANKAFKLDKVIEQLKSLNKSSENYIQGLSKIDFMLTGIYDRYMKYLERGYINWELFKKQRKEFDEKEDINSNWEKYTSRKNYQRLLYKAIKNNDLSLAFNAVNYTYPKAEELSKLITKFEKISENGGYTKVPKISFLKEGSISPIVKILRERLLESEDLLFNNCHLENSSHPLDQCFNTFDENVQKAVISFQKSHGLKADGIVGNITRKYLNIPIEEKIQKMRLNIERMRWMPRTLGDKYLLVNIPEYKLRVYDKNEVALDMKIVVGTKEHPTAIFSNKMSFIVLNPYWKIPQSIVKKEILPKVLEDSNYLNDKGINIHENWKLDSAKIDTENIDWKIYAKSIEEQEPTLPLRFIQEPSDINPLGRMKFMFPNRYSIYIHDTPAKHFFQYDKRAYSHGCIRVEDSRKLLEIITQKDPNINYEEVDSILEDKQNKGLNLEKKIPVHMVYLTSWIDESGKVQFRDDIYNYDSIQKKILFD